MPGTYSGNPVSSIKRSEPVEEAGAEGYGKYTTHQMQNASGWADWKNNTWTVCIVLPIAAGSAEKAELKNKTKIAFAVWNGNYQDIGGRKHYSLWADLILEK